LPYSPVFCALNGIPAANAAVEIIFATRASSWVDLPRPPPDGPLTVERAVVAAAFEEDELERA
jgi:hypothetical protein